jgi:hypothetical protein
VEEAVVALFDVLSYDLPGGTDKNHENFIQHNRRSREIRRAAPPKKQESPFERIIAKFMNERLYLHSAIRLHGAKKETIIIIIITYFQVYE